MKELYTHKKQLHEDLHASMASQLSTPGYNKLENILVKTNTTGMQKINALDVAVTAYVVARVVAGRESRVLPRKMWREVYSFNDVFKEYTISTVYARFEASTNFAPLYTEQLEQLFSDLSPNRLLDTQLNSQVLQAI